MTLDEYEAIRLMDLENLQQEQAAAQMGVARTTVQLIYNNARRKLADCLVNGKRLVIEGGDVALITCGLMVEACMNAAELLEKKGIHATVVNMHTIKPLDEALVRELAVKMPLYTVEEHSIIGGLGDAVAAVVAEHGGRLHKIGLNDCFGQSGKPAELLDFYGLTPEKIAARIESTLK